MVAAPVRAGDLHQLEVLELARARHVRTAAQVFEIAFAIERDVFAGRDAADDLGLVGLAHGAEMRHRLVTRQDAARNRLVLLRELAHLRFDGGKVLGRERALVGKVVVEAVLDDRADRHLRVGKQLLDRIGEQVRRRVADELQTVGVLLGDDREALVVIDREAGVDELAARARADAAAERGLGQARADRGGDGFDRHRPGEFSARAVGKLDRDHGKTPAMKKARTGRALSNENNDAGCGDARRPTPSCQGW